MTTILADITATDWSMKLGEPGLVVENLDDINQCLRVILETPKGSRAHEPLFGCDLWQYLDHPFNEGIPHIVRAVIEAVAEWEPRVTLISVTPVMDDVTAGHITLRLVWKLKEYDGVQQTEVTI